MSEDEHPVLRQSDVAQHLGLREKWADRVGQVVVNEDWMFAGSAGGSDPGWARNITDRLLPLLDVHTVEAYLEVEGQQRWSAPANQASGTSWNALHATGVVHDAVVIEVPELAEVATLAASEFQAVIAQHTAPLLADGHYDAAVRAGAIALRDVLRQVSGRHNLDGDNLAGVVLGGEKPLVALADVSTSAGKGEQAGWRALAQGCFAALRNPVAHRHIKYDRVSAMEAIATMSLIARRVTEASTGEV
jgi:uncharacterized protein (TIGR02391 family)